MRILPTRKNRLPIMCGTLVVMTLAGSILYFRSFDDEHDAVNDPNQPNVTETDSRTDERAAVLTTAKTQDRHRQLREILDPSNDGWESELIAEKVSSQLKEFAKLISAGSTDFAKLLNAPFFHEPLGLTPQTHFEDGTIRFIHHVRKAALETHESDVVGAATASNGDSSNRLRDDIRKLIIDRFHGTSNIRVDFKIIGIDRTDRGISAIALFEASGKTATTAIQQNATWKTEWTTGADTEDHPLLLSIHTDRIDEVVISNDGKLLFADCTASVFGDHPFFRQQLLRGSNYWMPRLPGFLSPRLLEGHIGISIGDINNDGLDDIYVCQPGGLPNRLYLQNSDGTVTDISATAGVDVLDWSYSSLIVDLNGDGHQDLSVLSDGQLIIFAGDGSGQFQMKAKIASTCEYSLTAADYDNDGDLDLYACNYFAESDDGLAQLERTDPLHDSNTGGRNVLYRNDRDWRFVDVTDETGLDVSNRRWSLAASWEDYDNDGDMDLYVVNDFGKNNLYRNEGTRFTELAMEAKAEDANQGMSASWADFNCDGWMDIYVSNMFSAAGNRVTFQDNFMADLKEETKGLYQQLARGNSLLQNSSNGFFEDVSTDANVTMGRWAWASLFVDINNDGWEDLLVTNGYLSQISTDDL